MFVAVSTTVVQFPPSDLPPTRSSRSTKTTHCICTTVVYKASVALRPFIFNLLVYKTGDRIFSKSGKKNKNPNCRFLFLLMVEKT